MDLVTFLVEVEARCGETDPEEVMKAALWFAAMTEANSLLDDWKAKDFAQSIQAGEPIGGPLKDETDLEEWIEGRDEWDDWAWLHVALDTHFGIKRG